MAHSLYACDPYLEEEHLMRMHPLELVNVLWGLAKLPLKTRIDWSSWRSTVAQRIAEVLSEKGLSSFLKAACVDLSNNNISKLACACKVIKLKHEQLLRMCLDVTERLAELSAAFAAAVFLGLRFDKTIVRHILGYLPGKTKQSICGFTKFWSETGPDQERMLGNLCNWWHARNPIAWAFVATHCRDGDFLDKLLQLSTNGLEHFIRIKDVSDLVKAIIILISCMSLTNSFPGIPEGLHAARPA